MATSYVGAGGVVRCSSTGKRLGKYATEQLVIKLVGCTTPHQHYKKQQLQAASRAFERLGAQSLWCPFCTDASALEAAGMQRASAGPVHMMQWLDAQCQQVFYVEHAVDAYMMWHGLVDAYFPGERLCIQFDGQHHLAGKCMHVCDMQLDRDVAFGKAAWHACQRVLRVHHLDGRPRGQHLVQAALKWCSQHQLGKMVVLSSSFRYACVRVVNELGIVCSTLCPEYMAQQLGAELLVDEHEWCWLHERTQPVTLRAAAHAWAPSSVRAHSVSPRCMCVTEPCCSNA